MNAAGLILILPLTYNEIGMIYQLKITLEGIEAPIWRRILIDPTMNMEELHYVTQSVMGWMAEHLFEFTGGDRKLVDPSQDVEEGEALADEVLISQAFPKVGDKLTYRYDFEDNWSHEVELEKITEIDDAIQYPICVDGARACPPEECGGIEGYLNVLHVLSDPKGEDYEELSEWLGGEYDAEEFDVSFINEELHDPENWVEEEDEEAK